MYDTVKNYKLLFIKRRVEDKKGKCIKQERNV